MRTNVFRTVFALVLAVVGVWTLPGEASQAAMPGDIVLGDSVEFGVGSTGGGGYVVPFQSFLEAVFGTTVELNNLSEPGAETKDIMLEQLPEALLEARSHRPYGVVVSLGGGGNDLRHFIVSPEAATCRRILSCLARLNALLNEAEQRLDLTLKALRAEAGPSVTILVRTQYNALKRTGCAPEDQVNLANAALEGAPGTLLARGLNPRLRDLAAKYGARVVDTFGPFFVLPDTLISEDCIHPNDVGYAVIFGLAVSAFGP
jgi:lysophospholipase L1-like esterase